MTRHTNPQAQRIESMREALGEEALALINNEQFLPMFRNRQINHPEEFAKAIEIANSGRIRNPVRWFAKIWSVAKLSETIQILRNYIEQARAIMREVIYAKRKHQEEVEYRDGRSATGRLKYQAMLRSFNLRT